MATHVVFTNSAAQVTPHKPALVLVSGVLHRVMSELAAVVFAGLLCSLLLLLTCTSTWCQRHLQQLCPASCPCCNSSSCPVIIPILPCAAAAAAAAATPPPTTAPLCHPMTPSPPLSNITKLASSELAVPVAPWAAELSHVIPNTPLPPVAKGSPVARSELASISKPNPPNSPPAAAAAEVLMPPAAQL